MFTWLLSGLAHADGHGSGADEVSEAIGKYWIARNTNDHETVANLESQTGMYGTNSDGSFHKPINVSAADDSDAAAVDSNNGSASGEENHEQVQYIRT